MSWEKASLWPVLGAALVAAARAEDDLEDLKLSYWDYSVNLRGGFGYKDNVLLSTILPEESAFWQSGADFSLLRAGLDGGPTVAIFVSGEDRRYFSSLDVDKEQLLLSQAKITQEVSGNWSLGGLVQYLYADQVFDASATEQLLETLPVKSHNMQLAPIITRSLPWDSKLELSLNGERQLFNEPLDDYWEFGPELIFTKSYGNRSAASISYTYDHRRYDSRVPLDLERELLEDVPLRFDQHEFEFTLNHSWDKDRRWRSRARILFEINSDNGVGFYDYYRYRLSHRFGYYGNDWQATVEGKILHYDYKKQPIFNGDRIRQVWEYAVATHLEKIIWKKLKVFLDHEYETVHSGYSLEEYDVNTVSGGVDWEF